MSRFLTLTALTAAASAVLMLAHPLLWAALIVPLCRMFAAHADRCLAILE